MNERKKSLWLVIGFFLAAVGLYGPALAGGPLLDDYHLLETAKNGGWFDNFGAKNGAFWRPAVSVLLKSEWLLFHTHFVWYRVVSALLCAITSLAIYGIVFSTTRARWAGVVAGLFFIAWPSHPETMLWIAGQTDGLGTCLSMLALWAFVSYWTEPIPSAKRIPGWAIALGLALLSKEAEVVMPAIVFAFAICLRQRPLKEDARRLAGIAFGNLALMVGYLWLRGQVLRVPLAGGGYPTALKSHGLLRAVYYGFSSYHINVNLLNTYAPLSGRLAPWVGLTADAFVLIFLTFGVAAVLRLRPRTSQNGLLSKLIPSSSLLFAIVVAYQLSDNYDLALLLSVLKLPNGLTAAGFLSVLSVGSICCRPEDTKATFAKMRDWSINTPYLFIAATVAMAYVLFVHLRQDAPHGLPYLALFTYWLLAVATRKWQPVKVGRPYRMDQIALLLAAASVVALVPVITVGIVDTNLVNARFSHLASAFAIPAIVAGLWMVLRSPRGRVIGGLCCFTVLVLAVIPVIGTWRNSERLADAFDDAILQSRASKVYVLASPGFMPSATTTMLGGNEVDAAGRLLREDGLPVLPGYYAEGFTLGDHLGVQPIGSSEWRVTVEAGASLYRSGRLGIRPTYDPWAMPPAYRVAKTNPDASMDIEIDDPAGEVVAVDENGVKILRAK